MMGSRLRIIVTTASIGAVCLGPVLRLRAADEPEQFSPWSAPVNLGPAVNSTAGDFFSFISRDGLSLYFTSSTCGSNPPAPNCRTDGYGGFDIYVSQRASINDDWGPAQNLGPTVNTPYDEGSPGLSPDGHVMYFASDRPGGFGGNDIYTSRRHNKRNDFGWQAPENLGSGINSAANESGPEIFEDDGTGVTTLYFDSNRPGGLGPFTDDPPAHNGNDIYASILQWDETFSPAALVTELSTTSIDRHPSIRRDGLEILFASNRPGSLTNQGTLTLDLWVSTRASTSDPWSTPVNVGPVVNSGNVSPFTGGDAGPALSFDGTTLYFQSNRPGVIGNFDLYVSTRTKLK